MSTIGSSFGGKREFGFELKGSGVSVSFTEAMEDQK